MHPSVDFDRAVRGRRSVRAFTPAPVPRETLRTLIEQAVWAPSAAHGQPWTFLIVDQKDILDRMSLAVQAETLRHLPAADAAGHFRDLAQDPDFHVFYHAPALVIVAAPSAHPAAAEDCALAAQTFMLAATARDIGTCWIGLAQPWLRTAEAQEMLGLSEDLLPVAPIAVGWPRAWPAAPPRRPPRLRWIGEA